MATPYAFVFVLYASVQNLCLANEKVSTHTGILAELEAALGANTLSQRHSKLEHKLEPLFASLPKNEAGRLGHAATRYALHRHFGKSGLVIKGLEPGITFQNASSPAEALQNRLPAHLQNMVEAHLGHSGLNLHELAVLVATFERLMEQEAEVDVLVAYERMLGSSHDLVSIDEAIRVLNVYAAMQVVHSNYESMWTNDDMMYQAYPGWSDFKQTVEDRTESYCYEHRDQLNPFMPVRLSMDGVTSIAAALSTELASTSAMECTNIQRTLESLGDVSTGRIALSDFYKAGKAGAGMFTENVDYLRAQGILDESQPGRPRVIITNYIISMGQCLPTVRIADHCCKNECDSLFGELEQSINGPKARPEVIVKNVEALSSSTVDAPRRLSKSLLKRLDEIASHHGGAIPLHGRLFMQWMHHAFPRDCPYPQFSDGMHMNFIQYREASNSSHEVAEDEFERHTNIALHRMNDLGEAEDNAMDDLPWNSDDDVTLDLMLNFRMVTEKMTSALNNIKSLSFLQARSKVPTSPYQHPSDAAFRALDDDSTLPGGHFLWAKAAIMAAIIASLMRAWQKQLKHCEKPFCCVADDDCQAPLFV